MPEGLDHKRLCKRWDAQHCLRGRKCPFDETDKGTDGENWHSLHDVNRPGLADYSQVEKPPTIDGCASCGIRNSGEEFEEFGGIRGRNSGDTIPNY